MSGIEAINEFVIRFANVNGTGSASANGMVAKGLFRSGLPIGPKNMFPSNIQGLPTWYEIRVSERGFSGRRGGVDLMVAMNSQTFFKDAEALNENGYLIYDSTRILREEDKRAGIHYLGLPITKLAREHFTNAKLRGLLQNMVYVGALAAFLDIDLEVFKDLVREQFSRKAELLESNLMALTIGFDYAKDNFKTPLGIRIEARELTKDKIIIGGNDACALGCVYAGATVAAWYPITPSTSLVDAFTKYCQKFRVKDGQNQFAVIQAEDEIASIGMVLGANWNGARSFTATSGPGISLMSEFLGYAYYAEIPAVLFNVQRCGPSTGMPTRTQQADLNLCAYASHGDTKHLMLFPANVEECFSMSAQAFDYAERFQTPVFVMSDLELAMNDYLSDKLSWDDSKNFDRGKVVRDFSKFEGKFFRYLDSDDDGIPYRSYPGEDPRGAYFTRGSGHDKLGRYTEDGGAYQENMERIVRKFERAATELPAPQVQSRGASVGIIAFGTSDEPLREALSDLADLGVKLDYLRIRAFPFHADVSGFVRDHDYSLVVEQNRDGQMRSLLMNEIELAPEKLRSVLCYDGMPMTAAFLVDAIRGQLNQ